MKMMLAIAALSTTLMAAEPWEFNINASLTGGITTYNYDWVGAEQGSFNWKAGLYAEANKQFAEKFRMENSINVEFGQTLDQVTDTIAKERSWSDPRVSSDEIDFNNRELLTLPAVSPYFGFRFQTNFMNQDETNTKVRYANPVKLTQSLGISKTLLEKSEQQALEFRLSAAANQSINREIKTINDAGIEFVTDYSVTNSEGYLGFKTYLNLYKALAVSEKNIRDAKVESVDVDWKNDAFVNVNRFIVITYSMRMLYNRYISDEMRMKNGLTVGFNFIASSTSDE